MDSTFKGYETIKQLSSEKSKRFGQVFQVKETSTGNLFVLKTVEKSNSIGYQQLLNESKFSSNQEGLPKIIQTNETENQFSILKNYANGVGLTEYWSTVKKRHRLVRLKDIVNALEPLFSTLENDKILHCDIKPENILVFENQGKIECSIIDFGLAFCTNEIPERKTLFQLAYSAPELVLNRLHCANYGTDVFSFCLIVYKLFSGRLPFSNNNPALQTQLQITYPIEKPFRFKKKLWGIIAKGLVKHQFRKSPNKYRHDELDQFLIENAKKRYSNFKEFAREINTL